MLVLLHAFLCRSIVRLDQVKTLATITTDFARPCTGVMNCKGKVYLVFHGLHEHSILECTQNGTIWCCRQHNISEDRAGTVHREMFCSVTMPQIALGWALRLG